jgi:hypothetical protein
MCAFLVSPKHLNELTIIIFLSLTPLIYCQERAVKHVIPCSEGVHRGFGGMRCPHLPATCFFLGTCWACSSILKVKAVGLAGTSVNIHRTTRRYVPENRTPHGHYCNDIKSYTNLLVTKWSICWIDHFLSFVLCYFACDFVLDRQLYLRHSFEFTLTHGDSRAIFQLC